MVHVCAHVCVSVCVDVRLFVTQHNTAQRSTIQTHTPRIGRHWHRATFPHHDAGRPKTPPRSGPRWHTAPWPAWGNRSCEKPSRLLAMGALQYRHPPPPQEDEGLGVGVLISLENEHLRLRVINTGFASAFEYRVPIPENASC